jgi:predicted dehydrogenase
LAKSWTDLSVLIAGCGSIGKRHARVLTALGVRDIRACDPAEPQRQAMLRQTPQVRVSTDYEAALAETPDAVFLCTPPQMHVPMGVEAVRSGRHVFCEKPIADTTRGVGDLARLVEKKGVVFAVGLCFRYHDGLVRARRALDAGLIGRLISIRALMGEHLPEVRPDYRTLFMLKSGGALDLMHDIDLALWYAAQPVRTVRCVCGAYSDIGFEAPDTVELLIGFQDRCVASVHLDFFQRPRRRQMELIGSEGCIVVEFARWDQCTLSIYQASEGRWRHETFATDRDDMFRAEDREFLEAAAGNGVTSCPISEALKSLEVVEAAQAAG